LRDFWHDWHVWFAEVEETPHVAGGVGLLSLAAAGVVVGDGRRGGARRRVADAVHSGHSPVSRAPRSASAAAIWPCARSLLFFQVTYDPNPQPDDPISIDREEFEAAYVYLAQTGVPLVADRDQAWRDFCGWRVNYDTVLIALATLTMAPYAPWSSDRSVAGLSAALALARLAVG
jgi:hypothetical protein